MNRKRGTLTRLALLCTAAIMATGAGAEESLPTISVSYVVADLTRPDGAVKLYQHIQRAAKEVCREPNIRDLPDMRMYRKCFNQAVDAAVVKVDSTALTALHRTRTHNTAG